MSTQKQHGTGMMALIGGTIIDGNGGTPIKDGVILIDGKRISAVGDRSTAIPANALQIPVAGKFIIPGLMNPVTVLISYAWPPALVQYEGRFHELAIEAAQVALEAGVTTVFDSLGPRDPLIKARDAINEGRASGARIYLCGHGLGCGGPYTPDLLDHAKEETGEQSVKRKLGPALAALDPGFRARINALWEENVGQSLTGMSLEEARSAVRQYMQSGIDYVTYLINSHRFGMFTHIALSPRVQRMIVEEAQRAGLPSQGWFATTEEGVQLALDARPDVLSRGHSLSPLSAVMLERIAKSGIFLQVDVIREHIVEWFRRHPSSHLYQDFVAMLETSRRDKSALIRAGVQALAIGGFSVLHPEFRKLNSTGAPESDAELGVSHVTSLQGLQELGMQPMDALMTVTRNVARAFKVDQNLGTLERGKLADLVVLDGNPLENAENYREIAQVIKEGNIVDRDALPTQRLLTAPVLESD